MVDRIPNLGFVVSLAEAAIFGVCGYQRGACTRKRAPSRSWGRSERKALAHTRYGRFSSQLYRVAGWVRS